MKSTVEKTINDVFEEFLAEQKQNLKPQSYSGYETAMSYFERFLDVYGPERLEKEGLTEADLELYEELYEEEGTEYCEIFGPGQIGYAEMEGFLAEYVILNAATSKNFLKVVGRVMHKLVQWLHEKGYMADEVYEKTNERVNELKADLPATMEVSKLMSEYATKSPRGKYTEELNSRFNIKKIEPGKLWLEDFLGSGELIGPVFVSEKISSMCRVGWTFVLWIGKKGDEWRILDSRAVYPFSDY
ncbi:TPA: hypothetical protein HA351_00660 [Methanosarcinaceae archaeon]|nr:hypothetical protein [Methanosarcinaceae archaeon]